MALGSTQRLTEMSTRNLPVGKERPVREADNLTSICQPIHTDKYSEQSSSVNKTVQNTDTIKQLYALYTHRPHRAII
jgi:hypothetical protein